jgi:seryl-tRNA synthetase
VIDINLIRKDLERYKKLRKGADVDAVLKIDEQYKLKLKAVEDMRAKRNASSQEIGKAKAAKDEAKAAALMAEVGRLKEDMFLAEKELTELTANQRSFVLALPNMPHESVPVGASEAENPVVRTGLAPKTYDFKPLDHQTVGEKLGILDMAAAAKLSGSRFALWKGAGARLLRSIINFQLDLHTKEHGYVETAPPYLVRPEIMEGTGQLPKFEQDLYKTTQEDALLYLIPTSEVPLTNLVRDTILDAAALPMKLTAYTPCFRQEAGSYGKDVRGVIRNHQFDKVELVWITKPEDSLQALEDLVKHAEKVLTTLELPHRVIHLCTGDMGFSSRKTYDLEVFLPSENRYREISSCSDCGDFQARRMQARFRREAKGSPELVHTLNGSGVAVGRLAAAILENGQQKDGSVLIPKALQPYFGAEKITAE